ncbi:MAG: hypothetical protein V3575_04140 [Candidatus Absconditabacteria bacterium]
MKLLRHCEQSEAIQSKHCNEINSSLGTKGSNPNELGKKDVIDYFYGIFNNIYYLHFV